jgi:hypothetical protein
METRIADYLDFLGDLGAANAPYFLEGGQAVNLWAEYFSNKGAEGAMNRFRPFTSKDCDLWVSFAAFRHIESAVRGGKLIKGTSPADGQIGIFTLEGDRPLRIDLMSNVYGIDQARIPRVLERAIIIGGISIIDPLSLFQSKCHCLLGLDQTGRQDDKHVRMLCQLLPEHFRDALEDTLSGLSTQRALISELKLLQRILKLQKVRQALQNIGADPVTLFPTKQLLSCGLATVEAFATTALKEAPKQ